MVLITTLDEFSGSPSEFSASTVTTLFVFEIRLEIVVGRLMADFFAVVPFPDHHLSPGRCGVTNSFASNLRSFH